MTLTMSSFDDMGDDDIFYSDEESDNEIFKVGFTLVYFPDTLKDKGCWKKTKHFPLFSLTDLIITWS